MLKQGSNSSTPAETSSVRSLSSEDVSLAHKSYPCCGKKSNPAHGKGRRFHLFQMLILPFIPILALIVQTAIILNNIMVHRQEVTDVETQVTIATELGRVVTYMQFERSEVAFYMYTNTNGSALSINITQRFEVTDSALANMINFPKVEMIQNDGMSVELNKMSFQTSLNEIREKISSEESSMQEILDWYTAVNAAMLEHLTNQIKETDNSGVWRKKSRHMGTMLSPDRQNRSRNDFDSQQHDTVVAQPQPSPS